jgi:hypothetical protein
VDGGRERGEGEGERGEGRGEGRGEKGEGGKPTTKIISKKKFNGLVITGGQARSRDHVVLVVSFS